MHPRFRASPCNSVQGGLHIQSVQLRARGASNCSSPCKSVHAQGSRCNVCENCLRRCTRVLLVCLAWWHGCRAVTLFGLVLVQFRARGAPIQSVHLRATGYAGISRPCKSGNRDQTTVPRKSVQCRCSLALQTAGPCNKWAVHRKRAVQAVS